MAAAEMEVEQRLPSENGLQWTIGDDEDKNEQEDTFGGGDTPAAPSDGQGGHGLNAAHLAALQEKRKRLK